MGASAAKGAGVIGRHLACATLILGFVAFMSPAGAQTTHVVLVVGLPGQEVYEERFHGWASEIHEAVVTRLGVPEENVVWLADDPSLAPDRIRDRATVTNMQAAVDAIGERARPNDRVLVVLIGHGTAGGAGVRFNLRGPDLSPEALDSMLDQLEGRRVAIVHTGSASGEFVPALTGENRTVITATRSSRESNETWFAGFFAEALAGDASDLDKNGRISLLEAFEYSRQEVARYFEDGNLLATEHALLDDNGDGEGTMEPGDATADGPSAATFFVGGSPLASASGAGVSPRTDDPVLARLHDERAALEQRVTAHRLRRDQLDPASYERELEALLVELALKSREIRAHEGAR